MIYLPKADIFIVPGKISEIFVLKTQLLFCGQHIEFKNTKPALYIQNLRA